MAQDTPMAQFQNRDLGITILIHTLQTMAMVCIRMRPNTAIQAA
jgi:hypothetical protein